MASRRSILRDQRQELAFDGWFIFIWTYISKHNTQHSEIGTRRAQGQGYTTANISIDISDKNK